MRTFLFGMFTMLVLLIAAGFIVVFTGSYQVAAQPHSALGNWILNTTFDKSVERQAKGIRQPIPFTAAMVADGAGEFKGTCQDCHGGIGVKPEPWSTGMLPHPPNLARSTGDLSASEVFWIVKNGVKMTGMPAFGKSHDDAAIWNIAAFVKALPKMSAAQYAAYKVQKTESDETGRG